MYKQMCAYEDMVHHPIRRHIRLARKYNIMQTNRVGTSIKDMSFVPNGYGSVKNSNIINSNSKRSNNKKTIMTAGESILPSVMSTPFVLSSKGIDNENVANNNASSPVVIHNQTPDFLGSYMDGVPINSVING